MNSIQGQIYNSPLKYHDVKCLSRDWLEIDQVNEIKYYRGLYVDSKVNWKPHATYLKSKQSGVC